MTEQGSLFIFAHQDDEYAAAPWILEELRGGSAVACVYLTDGGSRVAPAIRDAESFSVLQSLGVSGDAIAFLRDDRGRIGDRDLPARSLTGLAMIERWIESTSFAPTRVYSHSYEGGHPDHDAAHLISAVVASRLGLLDDLWHFALYNAYRCPPPFFSVLRQLPSSAPSRRAQLPTGRRLSLTLLCRHYPSQRKTWLGLLPGAFVERALLARESVVRFDLERLGARPHDGELLYERLFEKTYDEFAREVVDLVSLLRG